MSSLIHAHEHICDSIGMVRRVLVDDMGRPFRMCIDVSSQSERMKQGQIWRVRVTSRDPGQKGCFVDAGIGGQAYLQTKKSVPANGAIVEVLVKSEERFEKKPVVVLENASSKLNPEIQLGKLTEPAADLFYGGVELIGSSADNESKQIVAEAFDQVVAESVALHGGGTVHFEQTRALVAIDVDAGGRISRGDRSRFSFGANLEACDTIARQLSLTSIGGIVAIDFLKMSRSDDNRKIEETIKEKLALYLGRQSQFAKMSPFGVLEASIAHTRSPISFLWESLGRMEQSALLLLRDIESHGRSNTGSMLKITLSQELYEWLDHSPFEWRLALSDRIGPRFKFDIIESADQTSFEIRCE